MTPAQRAGVWPTDVPVQCRNEPPFKAIIRFRVEAQGGLAPTITCPHCARDYRLRQDGTWQSDRPLRFPV